MGLAFGDQGYYLVIALILTLAEHEQSLIQTNKAPEHPKILQTPEKEKGSQYGPLAMATLAYYFTPPISPTKARFKSPYKNTCRNPI